MSKWVLKYKLDTAIGSLGWMWAYSQKIKQNKNMIVVKFREKKTERKSNYNMHHSSNENNVYVIELILITDLNKIMV